MLAIIGALLPFLLKIISYFVEAQVEKGKISAEDRNNFLIAIKKIDPRAQDPAKMRQNAKDQRDQLNQQP